MTHSRPRPLALVGGDVRTFDAAGTTAEAVQVVDGRVARIGSAHDVLSTAPPETKVIDLEGRSVLPGLIDAHVHVISLGLISRVIDARFPAVDSISALVEAVAARAKTAPAGTWIRGRGFDHEKFREQRLPTRWDVDAVTPDHPVFLVHVTGHHALVNTRALELAGIAADVIDPKGGHYVRDADGTLTGMVLDAAMQRVAPVEVDVGNHGAEPPDIPGAARRNRAGHRERPTRTRLERHHDGRRSAGDTARDARLPLRPEPWAA